MSGPSLKKQDAHSSIHEAAIHEAKELRELFQQCLANNKPDQAQQVAEVVIEHWEMRTLKHAEAEEEGLYLDAVKEKPGLSRLINQLTRDHDLMRRAVERMKDLLLTGEVDRRMTALIDGLILIDELHNEDEMNQLLPALNTMDVNVESA